MGESNKKLRLIAFSDWRVQDLSRMQNFLNHLSYEPDIIIYAGDDTERFIQHNYDNEVIPYDFLQSLKISSEDENFVNQVTSYLKELIDDYKNLSDNLLWRGLSKYITKEIQNNKNIVDSIEQLKEVIQQKLSNQMFVDIIGSSLFDFYEIDLTSSVSRIHKKDILNVKIDFIYKNIIATMIVKYPDLISDQIITTNLQYYERRSQINLKDLSKYISSNQEINHILSAVIDKNHSKNQLAELKNLISNYRIYLTKQKKISKVDIINFVKNLCKIYNDRIIFLDYSRIIETSYFQYDKVVKIIQSFRNEEIEIKTKNWFEIFAKFSKYGLLAVLGNDCHKESKKLISGVDVHYLGDKDFIIQNYRFIGLDGVEQGEHGLGPTILSPIEIKNRLLPSLSMDERYKIIVSHSPPYGSLDVGIRFGINKIGSKTLRNLLSKSKNVRLVICGHVHNRGGRDEKLENYTVVNAASHDSLHSVGNIAEIELIDGTVTEILWHDTKSEIERIPGISWKIKRQLEEDGIIKLNQLIKIKPEEIASRYNIKLKNAERLHLKAKLLKSGKGLWNGNLILPNKSDTIYFDLETDLECSSIWLIGVIIDQTVYQFISKNWKEEREILEKFVSLLKDHPNKALCCYSATYYDFRALNNVSQKHPKLGLHEALKGRVWIDLCLELKKVYISPIGYKLKEFAKHVGYNFQHNNLDGLGLATTYISMVNEHGKINQEFKQLALEYNQDDIKAILHLIENFTNQIDYDHSLTSTIDLIDVFNWLKENLIECVNTKGYFRVKIDKFNKELANEYLSRIGCTRPKIEIGKNYINYKFTGFSQKLALDIFQKNKINISIKVKWFRI
jgi:Icc-related predicted phosphoesterase